MYVTLLEIFYLINFKKVSFGDVKKLSSASFFTMAETPLKINLKRKPNWSEEELQMMASGIRENREILFGKFSPSVTSEKRRAVWNEITKQ